MTYVEVRTTFPDHRKAKAAARELGMRRAWVVGHLVCLWAWAIENVPSDGSLAGIADADIEEAAQWPEERAGELVPVLVRTGFVDVEKKVRYLHDWDDYAGRLLRRREEDRERKAAERAARRTAPQPPACPVCGRTDVVERGRTRPHYRRVALPDAKWRRARCPGGETAPREPRDKAERTARQRRDETLRTARGVGDELARPADIAGRPADIASRPADNPPQSAASRAPARGRARAGAGAGAPSYPTVPHRISRKREAPSARGAGPPSVSTPVLGIEPADPRYPVAQVLATRYRWQQVTEAEWEDFAEEVDNEYPAGTARGADPTEGWRWLAGELAALPRNARDPKRAFFEQRQRVKADRLVAEEARLAEHESTKHGDAGPIASELAQRMSNGAKPKPKRMTKAERERRLRQWAKYKGQVPDEVLDRQMQRHGLRLADLPGGST